MVTSREFLFSTYVYTAVTLTHLPVRISARTLTSYVSPGISQEKGVGACVFVDESIQWTDMRVYIMQILICHISVSI